MSRVIINSIPFHTRVSPGARHILARDQARAKKLLAGLHAHGPAAFHARKHRHIPSHGHTPASRAQPVPPAGSATAPDSVDVTDSGLFLVS